MFAKSKQTLVLNMLARGGGLWLSCSKELPHHWLQKIICNGKAGDMPNGRRKSSFFFGKWKFVRTLDAPLLKLNQFPITLTKRAISCINVSLSFDEYFYIIAFHWNPPSTYCQDPAEADKLLKIQRELDETKIILHKTIDSVLARGERLDSLVEKSSDLSAASQSELFEYIFSCVFERKQDELFGLICYADTRTMMLVFETDVLQTGEENQSVLYHIINFEDHQFPVNSPESCSDVEAVG
ncbi:hypothetical protein Ahy_A03g014561 isoform E [Arachis hypogaea]|uniref:V-SNARE coiled-coil homology domain-containing protein n=1 Tax=Arachis hypogaea TaxID=3818 RepID=A0A445DY40_ARAHY|nr:hypothetical protein Ahy_A03g014561 isoform E [Arachis hypogaea]